MFKIDPNFWTDVENSDKLKHVIYGDTDSLYIHAPNQKYNTFKEASDICDNLSGEINSIITNLLNNHLLPKMNVDKKYNKTFFKTESVISKMILLPAKKNYAYLEIAKKGKIYTTPKIKYVGIPIVRSDYSKFAQKFIRFLIEDFAFNQDLYGKNISEIIINYIEQKREELQEELNNFNFRYIATPGRWKLAGSYKSETFTIIGMRLYNTIMDSEIFRPGINGLSLPIKLINTNDFLQKISKNNNRLPTFINNTDINKINYITIPTNYEVDILREKFEFYGIIPDLSEIWDKKTFGTIAKNILTVIRNHFEK